MTVLHIRLTSNNQTVNLPKPIHAQNIQFIRGTIIKDTTSGTSYDGAALINLDNLFNGFEIISNTNLNSLMLPFSDATDVTTIQFIQDYDAEQIKQSFKVRVYKYDGTTPLPMGNGAGQVKSIDLYFNLSEAYDYSGY
jgi:hypothetical protein